MKTCPNCKKENTLRPFDGPVTVRGVEVLGSGLQCGSCGEVVFSAADLEAQEKSAASAIVARGIRTGDEFKLVRKVADLKATDVAELLDVRPETVSRWERGEVEIPRAVAFALGELYERPRVIRDKLAAFASGPSSDLVLEVGAPQAERIRRGAAVRKMVKKLSSSTRGGTPKRKADLDDKPHRKDAKHGR